MDVDALVTTGRYEFCIFGGFFSVLHAETSPLQVERDEVLCTSNWRNVFVPIGKRKRDLGKRVTELAIVNAHSHHNVGGMTFGRKYRCEREWASRWLTLLVRSHLPRVSRAPGRRSGGMRHGRAHLAVGHDARERVHRNQDDLAALRRVGVSSGYHNFSTCSRSSLLRPVSFNLIVSYTFAGLHHFVVVSVVGMTWCRQGS